MTKGEKYKTIREEGGQDYILLTKENLPSHDHDVAIQTQLKSTDNEKLVGNLTIRGMNHENLKPITDGTGPFSIGDFTGSSTFESVDGTGRHQRYNIDFDARHEHSVSGKTQPTGGNIAINSMPPYYVVNAWRRVKLASVYVNYWAEEE